MSHYFALFLVPDTLSEHEATDLVVNVLDLYNSNSYESFELYQIPCECTMQADKGIEIAETQVAPLAALWLQYQNLPSDDKPVWRTFIKEWEDVALKVTQNNPYYESPMPDCSMCNGSGAFLADFPPRPTHDYWNIDGGIDIKFVSSNVWHVSELPDDLASLEAAVVITPLGYWHQASTGNWDYQNETWLRELRELIESHPHHRIVRCLLHG